MNSSKLEKNTFDNLLNSALDKIPDSIDKREGSIIYDALAPACYHLAGVYLELKNIMENAFVSTAYGEFLDLKVAEKRLKRKEATNSIVKASFSFSDEISQLNEGMRFSSIGDNPLSYSILKIEEDNSCLLKCENIGTIGNSYLGDILPISYITNLMTATIISIITPGEDIETDNSLRDRYILSINQNSFGGNIDDYVEKITSIDGVNSCQVFSTWAGGGTVKCSVIDSNLNPITKDFIEIIQTTIDPKREGQGFGLAPIGHQVTITTPEVLNLDITGTIQLFNGYTIEQLQEEIENSINNYLILLKKTWANRADDGSYSLNIYLSQISAAVLKVFGVANITNIKINGLAKDLNLEQSSSLQQIPRLGSVVFE